MSIAGLTAVRFPVLFDRCVALLLRCNTPGLACRRGCSRGSCCTAGGGGLEGMPPPSLLFFRVGIITYYTKLCITPLDGGSVAKAKTI